MSIVLAGVKTAARTAQATAFNKPQFYSHKTRKYAIPTNCLIKRRKKKMEDVMLISGLAGVVVIAGIDKFCESHGYRNAARTLKLGLPIAAFAAFTVAMRSIL